MSFDAIAPVLARIAAIESEFALVRPTVAAQPTVGFDEVLQAAETTAGTGAGSGSDVAAVTPFASHFFSAGSRHGVPPQLLAAVGYVESRYQPDVVGPRGAVGLMQLMPDVAAGLGVDALDPQSAIDGAARLLADHQHRFGSWDVALAAYFAGAQEVEDAGGVAPNTQASDYVATVMERMGMS